MIIDKLAWGNNAEQFIDNLFSRLRHKVNPVTMKRSLSWNMHYRTLHWPSAKPVKTQTSQLHCYTTSVTC